MPRKADDYVDQCLMVCSSSQEAMIRQYVMVQQYTNAELAAEITGYSVENICKTKERVIHKIVGKIFKVYISYK